MAATWIRLLCIALLAGGSAFATGQTNPPATNSQAVATSGLLPIYGVELGLEKNWIDGANFPSQSKDFPNAGVNTSFQQVWETLKPAGFNFVRVEFDVYDLPASANRAANVCNWAQHNNVKVLLVLSGTTRSGNGDYASSAAAFVKALAGILKADAYKAAYAQIAAYELEPGLNNPSWLHQVSADANAQELLTRTAQNIRSGETDALKGSGTDSTPMVVRASFDYELISAKAIAGTTLTDEAYSAAYSSLLQFLKPLAASPNIDLIAVDWFPGSISAGGVDKPPVLLRSLANDISGKQFLFTTGFSTAFHSENEQKQYYTMTFANLGDLRASGGPSSPFVGVIFRGALNSKPTTVPDPSLPQAVSKWDWPSKAGDLAAMWAGQKKSDEMNWWVESVRNNTGLLQAQADAFDAASLKPKAGMLTLGQISSAVSASANSAAGQMPGAAAGGATIPGQPMSAVMPGQQGQGALGGLASTVGQNLEAKATQGLSGLLDNVMQKLTTMEQSGLNGSGGRRFSGMPSGGNGVGMQSGGNGYGSVGSNFSQPAEMNPVSAPCPATPSMPASAPTVPTDPSAVTSPADPCNSYANPSVLGVAGTPSSPAMTAPIDSGAMGVVTPGTNSPAAMGAATPVTPAPTGAAGSSPSAAAAAVPGSPTAAAPTPAPMGLSAGSITLSKQDIRIQPANPIVGQTVQITASLRNQSSAAAAGVTVLASGARNAVLAEADSIQLPANSTYAATLQWVPKDASPTAITLKVSDGTGTEMASVALDPVNVTAAALANKVRAPIGSSTTGAAAGKIANANPGDASVGSGASGASAGKVDSNPDTSTALVPLGFAKIGDIEAENLVAGTPGSILLPISDPLLVPLTNIRAVLMVDGKTVQTQSAPMLQPQQSRSIVFSNVIIAQPGSHQARVGVQLMRAGKSQMGVVSRDIVVQASTAAWNRVSNSQVNVAANSTKAAQSKAPLRSLTPTVRTGATTMVASAAPVAASTNVAAGKPAAASQTSLTLRASDLNYSPAPASAGQMITFRIVVHNSGNLAVQQAALVLSLYADGRVVAASQPPIQFSVAANSTYQASWQAAMPPGRQIQFMASVTGEGSPASASGRASIVVKSAAPIIPKAPSPTKPGTARHP